MDVVYVELDRCMACLSCRQACQFQQANRNMGWSPNIFIRVDMDRRRIYTGTCLQCETPLCMDVCPVSAIKRDPVTGAVIVDREVCFGCGMCVETCPFGYMSLDDILHMATKCDLCAGDPKCVQVCMSKALHFGSIESLAGLKRDNLDLRLGIRAVPADKDDKP